MSTPEFLKGEFVYIDPEAPAFGGCSAMVVDEDGKDGKMIVRLTTPGRRLTVLMEAEHVRKDRRSAERRRC